MPVDCSAIQSCLYVDRLQRSFENYLKLDSCDQVITLRLERHTAQISLKEYEFGTWEQFFLYGVIRIE